MNKEKTISLTEAMSSLIVNINTFKASVFHNRFNVKIWEMNLLKNILKDLKDKIVSKINPFERYKHFKGEEYILLDKVTPEWCPEEFLYIYMDKNGKKWARFENNFNGYKDGVKRFTLMENFDE